MKSLIIAEKPSVARDIASALGRFKKVEDHFENDQYVISSAIGHLVELFMPDDIDPKLRFWRMESLPIIPQQFQLKPIDDTKSRFNELKRLMAREDVTSIINACDAGREGELIFTYIYELARNRKPVQRLWMQSMTAEGIRTAFAQLRAGPEMVPLQSAARCRSESDWLIGINGTRAVTTRLFGSRKGVMATVGRVQTPTLTLVVERERAIRNFQPRPYWRIVGHFGIASGEYEGLYQRPDFRKSGDPEDKAERVWERPEADRLLAELQHLPAAVVTEEKKRTQQIAPRLYDLTTLQREANNRYGFSASSTLRLAQALYEKHKVITYPRTDSKALPEDYLETCRRTLSSLVRDYPSAQAPLDQGWVRPHRRIFNNKEVSDHFAIIPTGESPAKLSTEEEKIYDLITRRFIAVFYPPAEYDVTTRLSLVGPHQFRTEGKVLVNPGWLEVYGRAGHGNEVLPALSPPDFPADSPGRARARVLQFELLHEATKPPARYTEATLLTAMEGAGKLLEDEDLAEAMKEKGLGTPATRAAIIEHLLKEKYLERDRKDLLPTAKAENLIDFLLAVGAEALTSPGMTGEWEYKLRQIEEGRLQRDQFMSGIAELTRQIVARTKNFTETDDMSRTTAVLSPTDQQPMLEGLRAYRSQDGKVQIYKALGNRKLEEHELAILLRDKQIGPLEGFRSRMGKPFKATLKLDENFKVQFEFANGLGGAEANGAGGAEGQGSANPTAPLDLSTLPKVGVSPVDGQPVYAGPNSYACARALQGDRTGFRMGRNMLGRDIPPEQVGKLLTQGKTDLLDKFKSKRNGRFFSAYLVLKPDKTVGFAFEERPAGAKRPPRTGRGRGRSRPPTEPTQASSSPPTASPAGPSAGLREGEMAPPDDL